MASPKSPGLPRPALAFPRYHPDNDPALRTQGHPDSDLARAPGERSVRHGPVESDAGNQQRQHRKQVHKCANVRS